MATIGGEVAVAIFHGLGDCVNATTLLEPLRARYRRVRWVTHERYAAVVRGNPLVDEVTTLSCHPLDCDEQVRPSPTVVVPHYQFQYYAGGMRTDGTLLGWYRGLRGVLDLPDPTPFAPSVCLDERERAEAAAFARTAIGGRRFVLMETEYGSSQSEWNGHLTRSTAAAVLASGMVPVTVEPSAVPGVVSAGGLHYRVAAALYDLAEAFVGVSSGVSCLVHAPCFRQDVPHLEFVRGAHWSTAHYEKRRKRISHSIAEAPSMIAAMLEEVR